MTIRKIEHDLQGNNRRATITLDVEQIMYISNALCSAVKDENASESLIELHRDMFLLFEIVKNGCIDSFTVEHLAKLQQRIEEKSNGK